jgi:hypothetical protein
MAKIFLIDETLKTKSRENYRNSDVLFSSVFVGFLAGSLNRRDSNMVVERLWVRMHRALQIRISTE